MSGVPARGLAAHTVLRDTRGGRGGGRASIWASEEENGHAGNQLSPASDCGWFRPGSLCEKGPLRKQRVMARLEPIQGLPLGYEIGGEGKAETLFS